MLRRSNMQIGSLLCCIFLAALPMPCSALVTRVSAAEQGWHLPVAKLHDAAGRAGALLEDVRDATCATGRALKLRQNGLMDIAQAIPDAIIDMKYAGPDNFTGQVIYPSGHCLIAQSTGRKLVAATDSLRELGYRLKVFDAYRPASCQQALYDAAPDKKYVANPRGKGSNHSRAAAIDMTICDMEGNEIPMPSGFDDLSPKAWRNQNLPADVEASLRMMEDIMINSGFKPLQHEWWHYDDTDAQDMPLLDIPLEFFD